MSDLEFYLTFSWLDVSMAQFLLLWNRYRNIFMFPALFSMVGLRHSHRVIPFQFFYTETIIKGRPSIIAIIYSATRVYYLSYKSEKYNEEKKIMKR